MEQRHRGLDRTFDEAVSLHEEGELAEAERLYKVVLNSDPDHAGSLHKLGVLRAQQGRLDEALGLLELAVMQNPESAEILNHVGAVLHALNRTREAISCFERAIAIEDDDAETNYNYGTALQALGQYHSAIEAYQHTLAIDPDIPAARYNLGTALQALNRHQEAVPEFEKALALEPNYARAHAALGVALHVLLRHHEAIKHYQRSLALAPADAEVHNNLGLALQACERHEEAIAHHQKALLIRPSFAAAHNNLGTALQALNRHDEAIAEYRRAIVDVPRHAARHANLGLALQEIGRLDEACREFERAVELAPKTGRFYRNLADCKRFSPADPQLAAMMELWRDRASLPEAEKRQLLFALGKAFADLGQHEQSFGYFLEGNALKREQIGYDEEKILGEFAHIRAVFDRRLMDRGKGGGHPSSVPTFVLGMPRSGTTLVEQVLASHPKAFGAGELPDFERAIGCLDESVARTPFPEVAASLSADQFRQLGAIYLKRITRMAQTAERITDKMPLNFRFIGLIHLALPNARIIHTRRDPVDTCVSCFATLFPGEHRVAYGLAELGRYYRAYEELMEHWRRLLPAGVMLEVQYEDLVADFVTQARRIVAHCDLEWDDACLRFYQTRRPVRTASATQVRQPIYSSSVGRWRLHGHLLDPLLKALGRDAIGATCQA